MVLEQYCLSWITHIWVQLFSSVTVDKRPSVKPLPDDIIIEILSRLPAKNVSVFRMVCKKWVELTSTYDFAHIHLQRNCNASDRVSILQCSLKYNSYESCRDVFIFNKEAKGKRMLKKMFVDFNTTIEDFPNLFWSYNGLVVFMPRTNHSKGCILNPTTHEHINIRCNNGFLFGFFFHQPSREYRLLCCSKKKKNGLVDYFLFTFETESLRSIGAFPYSPISFPVFFDGALHWTIYSNSSTSCENSLMTFNVESEDFNSFPHPGNRCLPSKCNREDMRLLENAEELCFCHTLEDSIDMWVLEDNTNRVWIKKYVVHLDWDINLYPFNEIRQGTEMHTRLQILNIEYGELLIFWKYRGLFVYNLEKRVVKKVDIREMDPGLRSVFIPRATSYVKSLVSLKVPWKYPHRGKFPTFGQVTMDLAAEHLVKY